MRSDMARKRKKINVRDTVEVLTGLHKGAIGDVIEKQGVMVMVKLRPRPGFIYPRVLQLMPSSVRRTGAAT